MGYISYRRKEKLQFLWKISELIKDFHPFFTTSNYDNTSRLTAENKDWKFVDCHAMSHHFLQFKNISILDFVISMTQRLILTNVVGADIGNI